MILKLKLSKNTKFEKEIHDSLIFNNISENLQEIL